MIGLFRGPRFCSTLLCGCGVAAFLLPMAVEAQTAAAQTADSSAANQLQDIIVTARRREENLQTVPIAITAVSQQTLEDNNVARFGDLQYLVPGMTTSNSTNRDSVNISIRGQGANIFGGRPGVIPYLDEVPIPGGRGGSELAGGPGLFFDLENVQVLKGPQGTLFGRDSVGGAILVQTALPKDEFGGRIQLGYGNYNNRELDAMLNIPVNDTLLVRFAFNGDRRDGFTELLTEPSHPDGIKTDDRNYWSARGTITFRPSESFENNLIITQQDYDSSGSPFLMTALNPGGLALFGGANLGALFPTLPAYFAQQQALGARTAVGSDIDLESDGLLTMINNITKVKLAGDLTLRNIFGYANTKSTTTLDVDGTPLPIIDSMAVPTTTITTQYTEELQLLGKSFGERLDWIIGGFYLRQPVPTDFVTSSATDFGGANPSGVRDAQSSKALYSQGTYDLSSMVSGLKFTAGLRYTKDEFREDSYSGLPASQNTAVTTMGGSKALTWTLGLDYQATDATLLYLTSRRGFRPGGFNAPVNGTPLPDYGPEYVTDIEFGMKSDWTIAGIPIRTDAAIYHQDYTDIQVQQFIVVPNSTLPAIITANAAAAKQWGAELEAKAILSKNWQLGLNFSYIYFQFKDIQPGVQDIDQLEASRTFNRPPYKYGVDTRYRLPLDSSIGDVSLLANWEWQAASGSPDLEVGGLIPSYGLLNLTLNWDRVGGSPVDLSLYGSNVLNKLYSIGGQNYYNLIGFDVTRYGEPRMYGVRVRYQF